MQGKISPDERITSIALESVDPFARPGQVIPPVNRRPAAPQRDFSHLDDPLPTPAVPPKPEVPNPVKKTKKPAAKPLEKTTAPDPAPAPAVEVIHETRTPEGLPQYLTEFAGRDIMVGFPCYKSTNPVTAFALVALALDFGRDKIRFDMRIGDAMIQHSRDRLVHAFLQTDAKYLLMMDDDIIPSIGRPGWMREWVHAARNVPETPLQRHIVHRLVNSGKTVVGGAYFGRQEGGKLMCSDHALEKHVRQFDDFIVPVDWVGTGCILIHRRVFDDIREMFPELATNRPDAPVEYFRPMPGHVGEDVAFCFRAKKAGHQPHIDLGTPVYHVGYKTY